MVDAARLELTREYFMHLEQLWSDYHDHKENMANAGLVVQIGLFAAISSSEIWPPAWMVPIPIPYVGILGPPQQAWAVYSVLWLAIHLFVRWQLNNRSIAALYVKCLHEELLTWLHTEPSDEDLVPYKNHEQDRSDDAIEGEQDKNTRSLWLWWRQVAHSVTWVGLETLRLLRPLSANTTTQTLEEIKSDVSLGYFPSSFVYRVQRSLEKGGSGSTDMERFFLWISLLLWALTAARHAIIP